MSASALCGPRARALNFALPRIPRFLRVLAAVVLALSQLSFTLTPGEAIRRELLSAADEMETQVIARPSPPVLEAMRGHLRNSTTIDAQRYWPNVAVTFHDVDAATCRDALLRARRIEGRVLVRLENFTSPAECGAANEMTWRIMP